jgi:putative ABC transport system permease protein
VIVVGVMREGFRFPLVHDVWQPLATQPELADQSRDVRRLRVFGRLAPGVDVERSRAELSAIALALSKAHPDTNTNVRPTIESFAGGGFDVTDPWNAMLIAVGIVLLIACANIANLLLARAAHRSHEIAIRISLGATRWRIMRQLLAEAALLAVVAGGVGIGLALLGVRLWLMSMPVANWPYWFQFAVDGRVLTYLGIISGGSAVLFGIGPALHMSKWYPGAQVKQGGRGGTTGPRTQRWTNVLLVAQFALTLSLLAGAGLLARTLIAVYRADSIVDTSNVILAGVDLPPESYATPEKRIALFSQLEARLSSVPFFEAAVLASGAPFYNAPVWTVRLQGQARLDVSASTASYVLIGSRYFDTLRLRLIRGRAFTDLDGTSGHHVAIVNQLFASRHFPGFDPIGQQIQLTDPDTPDVTAPWLTIVGVSPTVRQHYAQPIDPVVYVPYRHNPIGGMVVMARATSDLALVTPVLREQLRQLDPDLPLVNVSTLDWLVSGTQFANRVFATIFGLAAAFALVLAAVGLHAIIEYGVHQRRQEIGVRMALGAQSTQVVWLFVRRVFAPLAWGLAIGLVGAFGVGRFVSSMLIQTSPHDPATLVAISIVLIGVALAAAFRPARLATKVSPVVALRNE